MLVPGNGEEGVMLLPESETHRGDNDDDKNDDDKDNDDDAWRW